MKKLLLILVIPLLLGASCTSNVKIDDKASCEKIGGKWGTWSDHPDAVSKCNLPTSDAGKICTDSDQCQSYCQAEEGTEIGSQVSGKCYGWEKTLCMQEVRDGVVGAEWCY